VKLKDTKANHIYLANAYVDDQNPAVSALIYVWNNTFDANSHEVIYEIIASPLPFLSIFCVIGNVDLQEVSDPLLYVYFPHKTNTFENLLKGIPSDETTVLRKDIEVIFQGMKNVYKETKILFHDKADHL
jgi:hypothetical protein